MKALNKFQIKCLKFYYSMLYVCIQRIYFRQQYTSKKPLKIIFINILLYFFVYSAHLNIYFYEVKSIFFNNFIQYCYH